MTFAKTLWTVSMTTEASEKRLLAHAQKAGCQAVCIRTTNARLPDAISRFQAEGIAVLGWRWPACRPTTAAAHYYAPEEAQYVVDSLISKGLDGYVVDPESENDKGFNDWDDAQFAPLAAAFCQTIKNAAPAGFRFGVTAGCIQPKNNPHIPWNSFIAAADFVAPQTYWRFINNQGVPADINGGSPKSAVTKAKAAWAAVAAGVTFVPIAGELATVTAAEIGKFGVVALSEGYSDLHFYTDGSDVSDPVLLAIKAL